MQRSNPDSACEDGWIAQVALATKVGTACDAAALICSLSSVRGCSRARDFMPVWIHDLMINSLCELIAGDRV
jgi:hypothetical protein